jgi:DNA-binding transcriptional regulator YiaG
MMNAYSELYLSDAKNHFATMIDYAVNTCDFEADFFFQLFLKSSVARQFENGNPAVVSGLSGYELTKKIVNECYEKKELPPPQFSQEKSAEYWAGWALAQYQWYSGLSFARINAYIKLSEIISMYPLYHEMDISHFYDRMEEIAAENPLETNLKRIREAAGLSQSQLAKQSGVNLRNIQMYEQRKNDISKAQSEILFRLAKTLGCNMEDLMER